MRKQRIIKSEARSYIDKRLQDMNETFSTTGKDNCQFKIIM